MLDFDQVAIKKLFGSKLMSADDFMKLPADKRNKLITSGKVQFLKDGLPVPLIDAVRSIARAA
ncbi:MAG: hypothetical protein KTR31_01345 [Myxococcales bacterium]|nr:hypothetical protein [Myxococcales bacterium]